MEKREIEKEPTVPELSKTDIENITKVCFRQDGVLEPAELVFVFGSSHNIQEIADIVSDLLARKLSNKVFITGGVPKYADSKKIDKAESLSLLDCIDKDLIVRTQFFTENSSRNTLENVTEAL